MPFFGLLLFHIIVAISCTFGVQWINVPSIRSHLILGTIFFAFFWQVAAYLVCFFRPNVRSELHHNYTFSFLFPKILQTQEQLNAQAQHSSFTKKSTQYAWAFLLIGRIFALNGAIFLLWIFSTSGYIDAFLVEWSILPWLFEGVVFSSHISMLILLTAVIWSWYYNLVSPFFASGLCLFTIVIYLTTLWSFRRKKMHSFNASEYHHIDERSPIKGIYSGVYLIMMFFTVAISTLIIDTAFVYELNIWPLQAMVISALSVAFLIRIFIQIRPSPGALHEQKNPLRQNDDHFLSVSIKQGGRIWFYIMIGIASICLALCIRYPDIELFFLPFVLVFFLAVELTYYASWPMFTLYLLLFLYFTWYGALHLVSQFFYLCWTGFLLFRKQYEPFIQKSPVLQQKDTESR